MSSRSPKNFRRAHSKPVPSIRDIPKFVSIHENPLDRFGTAGPLSFLFMGPHHELLYRPEILDCSDLKQFEIFNLIQPLDEVIVIDDQASHTRLIPHLKTLERNTGLTCTILDSKLVCGRLKRTVLNPSKILNMAVLIWNCYTGTRVHPKKDLPEGPIPLLPAP